MTKILNVVSEEEYMSLPNVNYSSLSNLAVSPQKYKSKEEAGDEKETSYLLLGKVVDMLMTNKEKFDETVYVMATDKPESEMMLKYCITLANHGDPKFAYEASGYKISPERVAKKFEEEGKGYYNALIKGKGKTIIDAEMLFKANTIVDKLLTNQFTKKYFIAEEDTELLFQVPIVWYINFNSLVDKELQISMPAKSMLDIIKIDHKNKLIQPVDLKVGGEGFIRSFWRYKRYLQASMYTDAVVFSEWDDEKMLTYTVEPMRFIYCDSNLILNPTIYKMDMRDINAGRMGIDYLEPLGGQIAGQGVNDIKFGAFGRTKHKGHIRLTAELDWHFKNNAWDYSYDIYQSKGEVDFSAFSVKL